MNRFLYVEEFSLDLPQREQVELASSLANSGITTEQVTLEAQEELKPEQTPELKTEPQAIAPDIEPPTQTETSSLKPPEQPATATNEAPPLSEETKAALSRVEEMTVTQLRPLARELGNKRPQALRKADLIKDILRRAEQIKPASPPVKAVIEDGNNRVVGGVVDSVESQFAESTHVIDLPESPDNVEREQEIVEDEIADQQEDRESSEEVTAEGRQEQTEAAQTATAEQPLDIPVLQKFDNPKDQLRHDVDAFKYVVNQGVGATKAATLLNLHEVAKTQRSQFYASDKYPDMVILMATKEYRQEAMQRRKSSQTGQLQQQRQAKQSRSR